MSIDNINLTNNNKKPYLLDNCGNTCYMNSVIQFIYSIPNLNYDDIIKNSTNNAFVNNFYKLLKFMVDNTNNIEYKYKDKNNENIIDCTNVIDNINNSTDQTYTTLKYITNYHCETRDKNDINKQDDASHYLFLFIEVIENIKLIKNEEFIINYELENILDKEGFEKKINFTQTNILDIIDLNLNINNLQDFINYYIDYEEYVSLTDDNYNIWNYTKNNINTIYNITNYIIKHKYIVNSEYLIIYLRRFDTESKTKIDKKININKIIYIDNEYYKLLSYIVHNGTSINGGHYVCYSVYNYNKIHYFSDTTHTITNNYDDLENAYILLYQKINF